MTWEGALAVGAVLMMFYLPLSLLLTLQVWESCRYVRSTLRKPRPSLPESLRAAVIVPVKGVDIDLKASLRSLLHQDYPDYEVHFVGESELDPAYAVIQELIAEGPACDVHWHSSGKAGACGQKVHNLLTASSRLGPDVRLVGFIDSDASPGPHWLHDLARRVMGKSPLIGAITGYRVCVPNEPGLANWLLYAINSSAGAMLTGASRLNLIWGGSWLMRRELFDAGRMTAAWEGTLSDDMVATSVVRSLRKRVVFEPRIMVPSETSTTIAGLLEFLRRQFYMARHYSPKLWAVVVLGWTMSVAAFWGSVALAVYGAASGRMLWWLPASLAGATYFLSMTRAYMRGRACHRRLPEHQDRLRAAKWLDLLAAPLANLLAWVGVIGSAFSHYVTWRGIRYRLDPRGKVLEVEHLEAPENDAEEPRRAA